MQHDAHEFLNYLLNTIADLLQGKNCLCYWKGLLCYMLLAQMCYSNSNFYWNL